MRGAGFTLMGVSLTLHAFNVLQVRVSKAWLLVRFGCTVHDMPFACLALQFLNQCPQPVILLPLRVSALAQQKVLRYLRSRAAGRHAVAPTSRVGFCTALEPGRRSPTLLYSGGHASKLS